MPHMPNDSYGKVTLIFVHHLHAAKQSVKSFLKKPFSALITIFIVAVSLALPALLYLLLQTIQNVSAQWGAEPTLSVYLKQGATKPAIHNLISALEYQPNIKQINYISPQQGLKELKQKQQFSSVLDLLKNNPLPPVIEIKLKSMKHGTSSINSILDELKNSPLIDKTDIDTAWIERVQYILSAAKRITLVLSSILGVGLVLVVSNTIRLNTQTHSHDIEVLKFVGATTAYIQRPYLYRGFMYGCLGALLAWVFVYIALYWVSSPALNLFSLSYNPFAFSAKFFVVGLSLLIIGSTLSIMGAWIAVKRQLNMQYA